MKNLDSKKFVGSCVALGTLLGLIMASTSGQTIKVAETKTVEPAAIESPVATQTYTEDEIKALELYENVWGYDYSGSENYKKEALEALKESCGVTHESRQLSQDKKVSLTYEIADRYICQ